MNELKVFENTQFGQVRTVTIDNEPWFVAADVCKVLEHTNPTVALRMLDDDEQAKQSLGQVSENGVMQNREVNIINEPGLYQLVLRSNVPKAKAFKRWITHEVIPAIRKHGLYATDSMLDKMLADPDLAIKLFTELKAEREHRRQLETITAQQTQLIGELAPKASYYDTILQTKDAVSISKIAKDYGKSAIWMNQKLNELGVQYKQGDMWLLYQKHAEQGYTQSKTVTIVHSDGTPGNKMSTYWTQKGRLFIYDLLKQYGILPLIDRKSVA